VAKLALFEPIAADPAARDYDSFLSQGRIRNDKVAAREDGGRGIGKSTLTHHQERQLKSV
jgi:hypothetical protein